MEESPMKKTGHKQSLMLATLGAVMLLLSVPPGTLAQEAKGKFGGKQIFAKTVLGKEYRIETVEGEAGKYWVYWGDEKMKWEPKPFYPDESALWGFCLSARLWPVQGVYEKQRASQPSDPESRASGIC